MKFKAWFTEAKKLDPALTRVKVAAILDVSVTHVQQLMLETGRPPSWVLMKRIQIMTKNKVGMDDWDDFPVDFMPPKRGLKVAK